MTKIASISLDIRKNNAVNNDPIVLRQGDSDVIIEASISNDGYPDLGINFATFVAKKPDGTIISNDPANVSGNVISYPISKHLTESVGKIQDAYFMINNETTTNGFDISVIPSTQLDDTSVNYIPGIENINKFLESAETDWLGRIQQMKTQIAGLDIPAEFKLLMDKALSDAKTQYQPTIDAAEANVENIVADLAAKKLDLTNNSDELNQTITTIQTQVASVNSFLDSVQKQIIEANSSFTAGQQAQISQSIADSQKKLADSIAGFQKNLADSIASMQSEVAQTVADLKSSSNSAITEMQNNQSTAMAKVNQNIADANTNIQQIQQSAKNVNDSIQNMEIGGRNLVAPAYWHSLGNIGFYVVSTGEINAGTDDRHSDLIELDTKYSAITLTVYETTTSYGGIVYVFFDKDKKYLTGGTFGSSVSHEVVNYPTNAVYLGLSVPNPDTRGGKYKVEYGTTSTDWTPAPEDVQTAISNALGKVDVGKTITATDDTGKTVNLKITGIS